ncbi:hypothetical protein GCM10008905_02930 [Clostridium malenominatum]|uniref:Uncharacterized protein n=1 Tax=Clostridium malenominatum TaxID=1539 RepID=A0ABN1IMX5_9CLOT
MFPLPHNLKSTLIIIDNYTIYNIVYNSFNNSYLFIHILFMIPLYGNYTLFSRNNKEQIQGVHFTLTHNINISIY